MILGDIRDYLKHRDTASVSEVAIHFDVSKESAQLAIDYWVKKGKVKPVSAACGSSCGGCDSDNDSYQWVDKVMPVAWFK